MSRLDPEGFVETAEMFYHTAVAESARVLGKSHRRTRRLSAELAEVQQLERSD